MILALLMADPVVMDGSVAELPGAFAKKMIFRYFQFNLKGFTGWGALKKGRNRMRKSQML